MPEKFASAAAQPDARMDLAPSRIRQRVLRRDRQRATRARSV